MNSFSTFGIFALVLFAYNNTPAQALTIDVTEAVFEEGPTCYSNPAKRRHTILIRFSGGEYHWGIRETTPLKELTRIEFDIKDVHTMIWNIVVLGTSIKSLRLQFPGTDEAQQLFDLAALPFLGMRYYSYRLNSVYKYKEECVLRYNTSFSGYAAKGSISICRYVIHTGGSPFIIPPTPARPIKPFFLWTSKGFNYCDYDARTIVLTLPNPVDGKYDHYLMEFDERWELAQWKGTFGKEKFRSKDIPVATDDPKILSYFAGVYTPVEHKSDED